MVRTCKNNKIHITQNIPSTYRYKVYKYITAEIIVSVLEFCCLKNKYSVTESERVYH